MAATGLPAQATPFTTTIPGTTDPIPSNFPEAGGFVVVLVGANGNYYFQFVEPTQMFVGFANTGTPVAFQGNPTQIAPTFNIDCGPQGCATYFGGSIAQMHFRFTVDDGDTRIGEFDEDDMTLLINGFNIGNWTPIPVETTSTDGTVSLGTGTGFGDGLFDTGWFSSTDAAMLADVFTNLQVTTTMQDVDPDDNFWDFTAGPTASGPTQIAPGWTIDKRALSTSYANVNDVVNYEYDLVNVGTVQLSSISISDDRIATVTCPSTSLAPGATMTCTGSYTVTQADIDAGSVTNTATATGTPQFGTLATIDDMVTVNGPAPNPVIAIVKTADTSGLSTPPAAGETITYAFAVTNTGNVTLNNVSVTDPLASVSGGPLASLSPGVTDTTTFTASYQITQTDINSEGVSNQATVNASPPTGAAISDLSDEAGTLPADNDPTQVALTASPSLSITKLADDDTLRAVNDTITYTYTVTNTGNVPISGVSVNESHNGSGPAPTPENELIQTDVAPLGDSTDAAQNGSWDVLGPGDSITFTGTYQVTQTDVDTLQ